MGEASSSKTASPRAAHYSALLSVPVIWGSYGPLLQRVVLPSSLPIPVFNLLSFLTCTLVLHLVSKRAESSSYPPSVLYRGKLWSGGVELGVWLFLGATCLAYGLGSTPASKAAVILSMKSVNVSMLECFSEKRWPGRVNVCTCILAVYGVWLVTTPPLVTAENEAPRYFVDEGSLLVLAASIFYSIHIFRLGILSKTLGNTPLSLAAVKGLVMSSLTLVLICSQWLLVPSLALKYSDFLAGARSGLMTFLAPVEGVQSVVASLADVSTHPPLTTTHHAWLIVALCIVWNGGGNIGYSMWAQVFAQKHISSTAASFVYASTPVWTVFWSCVLLEEGVGAWSWGNWLGAVLLLTAVFFQLAHSSGVMGPILLWLIDS